MALVIQVPSDLEQAVREQARRSGVSEQDWAITSLRRTLNVEPPKSNALQPLPVFEGERMPHQSDEWWEKIRRVAYEDDE